MRTTESEERFQREWAKIPKPDWRRQLHDFVRGLTTIGVITTIVSICIGCQLTTIFWCAGVLFAGVVGEYLLARAGFVWKGG